MNREKIFLWAFAIFFQAAMVIIAQAIVYYSQNKNLIAAILPENINIALIQGLTLGIVIYLVIFSCYKAIESFRIWSRKVVMPMLKSFDPQLLLAMGVLAGVSEELLFRGALQPIIGIIAASLLFGLVHYYGKKELLLYGVIATLMGLIMGAAYIYTGEIVVAILAHSSYNFLVIKSYQLGIFS
ncbi:MAG: type II CAAX endopeptidase family protein [Bacillota bacterium]|nr:type II CAAX endopeptidase family protein [Bacillota bacterium]